MKVSEELRPHKPVGALPDKNGATLFRVWAPFASQVLVDLNKPDGTRLVPLHVSGDGYYERMLDNVGDGDLYRFVVDGHELPDPASRSQPEGVHGPSRVTDHSQFHWTDGQWRGVPLTEYVIYELHVGTFTREGTFGAIAHSLDYFKELGINAIEIMPVNQFPGDRNWGYDGTFPFAPQNTYGGPAGLKSLVDACHNNGLAIVLDVVYNHLGPEGNYLNRFGPYFTERYKTPWGNAVNFDGPFSDEVRHFFIQNALDWLEHYHIDALRLDAIHGIYDFSARTFLEELVGAVKTKYTGGPGPYLIAECDLNDIHVITPQEWGGKGFHAQWNDDFHHALHCLLTDEKAGYYEDFGTVEDMAKTLGGGYVFSGQFSRYRRRKHGSPSQHRPCHQFVVFSQNHDQIGNRALGERLASLVPHDRLRLAALMVLMAPSIPLLFMGEEYGETAPFLYFVSHGDEELAKAVTVGRSEEFASFHGQFTVPDPQLVDTFQRSKINRELRFDQPHASLFAFYRHLLKLRRSLRPWELKDNWPYVESWEDKRSLCVVMPLSTGELACLCNLGKKKTLVTPELPDGSWVSVSDTFSPQWGGPGKIAPHRIDSETSEVPLGPFNAIIYRKEI